MVGRRDFVLIGILIYTAACVGAVARLRRRDFYEVGDQFCLRFHEKGGKDREIPVRHDLQQSLNEYLDQSGLADCRRAFIAAAGGDFDLLVSLLGPDLRVTFALSMRAMGVFGPVQAFSLKADAANLVTLRNRNVISRHRQQLSRPDFHGLLSVRQL